ncbi:nucleoside diphosphate kinase [miscellaneous Crenarchaeota group archaeon SMTZ-80]|nr:MAG: nucleoside diphosphate kinase [miscellaneous Crenarchaeota group archaeon SMTZ-80]
MLERTFILFKPDSIARGLIGEILSRFEKKSLKIVAMKLVRMDKNIAGKLYSIHLGKKFYDELITYVTSGAVIVMVIEGINAVRLIRKIIGATNPLEAEMGSIRGDYGSDITYNLIHASDSLETAEREIKIFFNTDNLA